MCGKIDTLVRTVRGLSGDVRFESFDDPTGLLAFSEERRKAYVSNPFLESLDEPCQLIGVKDGKVIGRRNSFPGRFVADGVVYGNRISGSFYVDPKSRSSLYALKLFQRAQSLPNGDVNINCYLSEQNQKFYRLLGAALFKLDVFEAGGRWSQKYRHGNYRGWKRLVVWGWNLALALANAAFDGKRWWRLPGWEMEELPKAPVEFQNEYSRLVKTDGHKYRQDITPEWLAWTLANDFYAKDCRKHLIRVSDHGKLVGYALVRYGISTKVNRIYEWQLARDYADREADFLSIVAMKINRFGCRTQIPVGDASSDTVSALACRFSQSEGNYAVVTVTEDGRFGDKDDIKDPKNWRVRPGMGDASLW